MIEEANELYQNSKNRIHPRMITPGQQTSLIAVSSFYAGEYEDSKQKLLPELERLNDSKFFKAVSYYYLALIERRQGKIEDSKMYLVKAIEIGENYFVKKKAEKVLEYLTNKEV